LLFLLLFHFFQSPRSWSFFSLFFQIPIYWFFFFVQFISSLLFRFFNRRTWQGKHRSTEERRGEKSKQ
jgi:hypothetical protein